MHNLVKERRGRTVNGIVVWRKRGPREEDWEPYLIAARENDGLCPYERLRMCARYGAQT